MNWLSFYIGFASCVVVLAAAIAGGIVISDWLERRAKRNAFFQPLRKAVSLLREVRGTLGTDQFDGHVRIAVKIDDFLRSQP